MKTTLVEKTSQSNPPASIKTILCCLCASLETRRYFWETSVTYTLLVNELLEAVPKRPEFSEWKQKGSIVREAVRSLLKPLKTNKIYAALPKRFFTSAELLVCYIYKSWLALQRRRHWQLMGKLRWLQAIENDLQAILSSDLSLEAVQSKAHQLLEQAQQEWKAQQQQASTKRREKGGFLLGHLLNAYEATVETDELKRRAIGHLLRHDFKVSDKEDTPEAIQFLINRKKIAVERLQEQLQSQLPQGRDPTSERFLERLGRLISLPDLDLEACDEECFSEWRIQKQLPLLNPLPYPILYGSADDLYWEISSSSLSSDATDQPSPKKSKRSKRPQERLKVRFKGLNEHKFGIQCDRRQLATFRQFTTDYISYTQASQDQKFGMGLFALRSACLIWKEDPQGASRRKKRKNKGTYEDAPWETHRLYLHCTIDTRLLTQEGTEQVQASKLDAERKALEHIEVKESQNAETLQFSAEQQKNLKRKRTTVYRLENQDPPTRPSLKFYEGKANIVVGVSLSRHEPITAIVFDTAQNKVLECLTTKALLKIRGIQSSRKNRSIVKLQREQYQLLRRWRRKRKHNLIQRPEKQRQDNYHSQDSESKLGDYLDRLIAARLVELAARRQASAIILPEIGDIRESIESSIQAKAQSKYPKHKELQKRYNKRYRSEFHRWSYGRLQQYISESAKQNNLSILKGKQPKQGTEQEKVLGIISSAIL